MSTDPNLAIDPALLASIAGATDVAPRIWARALPKNVYQLTSFEDDRGLLLEERLPLTGENDAMHPRYKLRIVIQDQENGRRFVHWEVVEATGPQDAFAQYSTERVQAVVEKVVEEMIESQKAQQAALEEAARKATGKMTPARKPGIVVPGNFKHRRGH